MLSFLVSCEAQLIYKYEIPGLERDFINDIPIITSKNILLRLR